MYSVYYHHGMYMHMYTSKNNSAIAYNMYTCMYMCM